MAGFCTKCGAALSEGAQACSACGTPIIPLAAVAPPFQPMAPPPKSGNSPVKIILIIVAVFVGLGIVGAGAFGFIVWRIARTVHVSGSGNQVTLNTPGGSISTNTGDTYTASDLGIEIYPGAQAGKGSMRMTMPTGTMVTAVYVTSDSKDQVVSFYKSKLGSDASVYESGEGSVLTMNKGQQNSIVITISSSASEYDGKTQIHIVHTTSTKSS
jgi:hypothetical protein